VLRRWWKRGLATERAAALWSASLPGLIIGYYAFRHRLDLLVLFLAASLVPCSSLLLRYFLRDLASDRPEP
jgi:hypothetical protein